MLFERPNVGMTGKQNDFVHCQSACFDQPTDGFTSAVMETRVINFRFIRRVSPTVT
jgi:hypothetical protein